MERVLIVALTARLAKLTARPRLSEPAGYCSRFRGEFSTERERKKDKKKYEWMSDYGKGWLGMSDREGGERSLGIDKEM